MVSRVLSILFVCVFAAIPAVFAADISKDQVITLSAKFYRPNGWEDVNSRAERAAQMNFFERHPDIRLRRWTALSLPGGMFQQADLLAFAGGVAADIQPLFIHQLQFFAQQGLLAPLEEFVKTGGADGGVWEGWRTLPESFQQVGTYNDRIYGIPSGCYVSAFIFDRDRFEEVGLDPRRPPATLDELWRTSQKLTRPDRIDADGKPDPAYAFTVAELEQSFLSFFFAHGAKFVNVEWVSGDGTVKGTSEMGASPPPGAMENGWKPRYKLVFDSPEGRNALKNIWKFRWAPWTRDPATGEILDLTEDEAAAREGVNRGVVFPALSQEDMDAATRLRRGRAAIAYVTLYPRGIPGGDSGAIRLMPFPPTRAGASSPAPLLPIMMGLNRQLENNPRALRAGWEWIRFVTGPESSRLQNEIFVEDGSLSKVSLWELRRSGMENLIDRLPSELRKTQEYLYSGTNIVPFFNGWLAVEQEIISSVIKPMLADPDFDFVKALAEVQTRANEKVLGHIPEGIRKERSGWALVALLITLSAMLVGGAAVVRRQARQARAASRIGGGPVGQNRRKRLLHAVALLGPALVLIAIFSYYPIGRGVLMAFQDYRLVGESLYNGLDNFSEALFASRFWISVLNTIVFVVLNLGIGFLAPFLLAILVSELPRGTALYRTIFYLPAVTAGLVVSLLWMRMYLPSMDGVLNQMLDPLVGVWNALAPASWHVEMPLRWLEDPRLAMFSVILPTVWASAGPGSLIYLAALKGISEETYEAADLDGCGLRQKFLHVTLPGIFPLLLINFIGAFIGAFQGMGNIFVMTGGGPNYSTHVLALEIWQNAFLYLRFGVATAQAWMLAATLIGFVVIQMRILEKMDWRKA